MQDYASLALGVIFAAAGGELFVRGAIGLIRRGRGAVLVAVYAGYVAAILLR